MSDERDIRAKHIAKCRADLAARHAADPEGVRRFEARMANLTAAKKRERERFETRVLGRSPAIPSPGPRPKGMSKAEWRVTKERLRAAALAEQSLSAKWSHKQGTPETLEQASRTHQGALAQLHANGTITDDQLAWAAQIAKAAESIEHDVDVRTASLEARVDTSRHGGEVEQRLGIVRLHVAYTRWREGLPQTKRLVLDMLVGEPIGYTVAAKRHRVHWKRAKRELIHALDRWPDCLRLAH